MKTLDILNIFMMLIGLYLLTETARMVHTNKIGSLFLAAEEQKQPKDEEGFVAYVKKPFCFFSIILILLGGLGLITSHVWIVKWFSYPELAVFLLSWMYFMKCYQDARSRYIS